MEFDVMKMTNSKCVPDLTFQKSQIAEKLKEPMVVGQSWYVIDAKWLKTFKYFVGLADNQERNQNAINPGPIDNGLLLDDNSSDVKKDLLPSLDYVAIPASAWDLLYDWYGLKYPQKPIIRKVVNFAQPPKEEPRLEMYQVELNLYDDLDVMIPVTHSFSGADKIAKIEDVCRNIFNIPDEQQFFLRCYYGQNLSLVLNKDNTIHQESLDNNLKIVVDLGERRKRATVKNSSSWNRRMGLSSQAQNSPLSPPLVPVAGRSLSTAEGNGCPCTPGLSGLANLGNTCFLNSVIQCLSNCPPIMQYFLDRIHEREINITNPFGKGGVIATACADVIRLLWSGQHSVVQPVFLKVKLATLAPQFIGSHQHDVQELLTFLLDGLHEDLNRINEKSFFSTDQNEEEEQEDEALAQSCWGNFLRNNDSIIIDHFHGMLKSSLMCTDCETTSVKFETFSSLSLPLPTRYDRTMKVRYVPYDQSLKVVDLIIDVPKNGTIQDIVLELSQVTSVDEKYIILAEVYKSNFQQVLKTNYLIQDIDDRETIYMYDLPAPLMKDVLTRHAILPIVLREIPDLGHNMHFLSSLFGTPFLILLPVGPINVRTLYDTICQQMTRACEEFQRANTNFDYFPMDNESGDGEAGMAESTNKKLFTPVLVDTSSYDILRNFGTSQNDIFTVPACFGQDVLALQIEGRVKREHYKEETPLVKDCTETLLTPPKSTLEECLTLFTKAEKLAENNAWHCPHCNEKKRATKKVDLWKLPNILIFHLKRFSFNEAKREKLNTKIEFPLIDLNMDQHVASEVKEKMVYDLVAVCNHYEYLTGGHYTANCKNFENEKWYCFDDSVVSQMSPECVQTSSAYLLFYMRRPTTKADPNEEKVDL